MTTPDFRALCAELLKEAVSLYGDMSAIADMNDSYMERMQALFDRTRAALAVEAERPTDAQIMELLPTQLHCDLSTVCRMAAHGAGPDINAGIFRVSLNTGILDFARAVLARWGGAPQQPVPSNEREPRHDEDNEDGEVWVEEPGGQYALGDTGDYDWEPHRWVLRPLTERDIKRGRRWLPASALPLPEVE